MHNLIFSALEGLRQNYELNFQESSIKTDYFYLPRLFVACGLMLLPLELFLIVISCTFDNSSMKFKFIHKIFVIQEKLLVYFKLLQGPDITR